jgi:hypothetical protein
MLPSPGCVHGQATLARRGRSSWGRAPGETVAPGLPTAVTSLSRSVLTGTRRLKPIVLSVAACGGSILDSAPSVPWRHAGLPDDGTTVHRSPLTRLHWHAARAWSVPVASEEW